MATFSVTDIAQLIADRIDDTSFTAINSDNDDEVLGYVSVAEAQSIGHVDITLENGQTFTITVEEM